METPETAGNGSTYPGPNATLATLLKWHFTRGTRADRTPDKPGKRWTTRDYIEQFGGGSTQDGSVVRKVRNWLNGKHPPQDFLLLECALFGDEDRADGTDPYAQWRADLRQSHGGLEQPVAASPPSSLIPRVPPHFLGRDASVTAILDVLLGATGSVAIMVQGGPGMGKTTLTQAVANHPDTIRRFGERNRWFVPLGTAGSAAAMQDAVARALGSDPARGFEAALAMLRQQPGLLVLDNLETPWDPKAERAGTEEVLAALADVPGVALLASFRGEDRVGRPAWAFVYLVTELEPPHDAELFCRIAHQRFPDDPHLPRFMAALGGIPLALELVGARAYGEASLAALWIQWECVGAALATHPDFDADRQTSLPHSIELSLTSSRLTSVARRLFGLLGQLPAGIVAEDRIALLGPDGFDGARALRRVGLAVQRDSRLNLLPPIREHASRHHAPDALDSTAWPAHYLKCTRDLGEQIGRKEGSGAVARLAPELANIEAAIRAMLTGGHRMHAIAALKGFSRLTYTASLPSPTLRDLAMACHIDGDLKSEADCIRSLGDIAVARSDHEAATSAYKAALPIYEQIDCTLGKANCIWRLGNIALTRSKYAAAQAAYEDAIPLYRQNESVLGEANCVEGLGNIHIRRSKYPEAEEAYEAAISLFHQAKDLTGEANCVQSLGDIALAQIKLNDAQIFYDKALLLYQEVGSIVGISNCKQKMGDVAVAHEKYDVAQKIYIDLIPIYQKIRSKIGEANCVWSLADIAMRHQDYEKAELAFKKALPLYHEIGTIVGEADCMQGFGDIALARLDDNLAGNFYYLAFQLYQQAEYVMGENSCINKLKRLGVTTRKSTHRGGAEVGRGRTVAD